MNDFADFIANLPELDIPFEGASGYLLQGENQQVAFVRFDKKANAWMVQISNRPAPEGAERPSTASSSGIVGAQTASP